MIRDATVDSVLRCVAPDIPVDRAVLGGLLHRRPAARTLVPLLSSPDPEIVRAAVLYLGCQGSAPDCPFLVLCLRHQDEDVARLAEHCLWSLWMQGGSEQGNRHLSEAIRCIRDGDYNVAAQLLTMLIAEEPAFAEAHFQLGIALSSQEKTDEAAQAYRQTLRLNPSHFGAAAALGHASVEQGNLPGALHYYRRALQIHPRLEALPEAVRELEAAVGSC